MKEKLKKYSLIYFLYFCVFLCIGGLDKVIALYFNSTEGGAVYYGFFLTAMSLAEIVLPTIANRLTERIGAKKTTYLYFAGAIVVAFTMYFFNYGYVLSIGAFIIICGSRTIFNFSVGNDINFAIDNNEKGKYFAGRDLFLYMGISLSLLLAGFIASNKGPKLAILALSVLLILPCIVVRLLKLEHQGANEQKEKRAKSPLRSIFRHKEFVVFLCISILGSIYGSSTMFIPFLAVEVGLNYSEILASFAGITMMNAVLAFIVGNMADKKNKKLFFIIDVASDFIPALIFTFTRSATLFLSALVLSAFKDIFAPATFAYKYELFGRFNDDDSKFAIAVLESVTSAFVFAMPSVMGLLWNCIGSKMFIISLLTIFFSVILAVFCLPDTSGVPQK